MRTRWWFVLLLCGIPEAAHADSHRSILSLIQRRIFGASAFSSARPSETSPSISVSTRVGNVVDVEIGGHKATHLGTAIWRAEGFLAWHDGRDDAIWICRIDPDTGDLIPADGKGTFIGEAAPFVWDVLSVLFFGTGRVGTNNGPEWGADQDGVGVYLTIEDENGIYQQGRCLLDNFPNLEVEQFTFGGIEHRFSNLATQNPADPQARVGYYQVPLDYNGLDASPAFWKFPDPAASQHQIPLDVNTFNGARWIPKSPSLTTFLIAPDETVQVAEFNTDTESVTFLTSGPENHAEAEIVLDPDTNLPRYMTCIEDDSAIAVYELIAGEWVKLRVVIPPLDPKFAGKPAGVFAVKPFFVRGELFFIYNLFIGDSLLDVINPLDIYLGSADGTVSQRLTAGTYFTFRLNPQYYIGTQDNKVFLYYYTHIPVPFIVHLGAYRRLSFTIDE